MNTRWMNNARRAQNGVVTLSIGILLLILITLMTLYGARVGLVEQRISANDYRAKLVHGAAEAGRNNATEFLNASLAVFVSDEDQVFLPDGSIVKGWRADGNVRWGNDTDRGDPVDLGDCSSPADDYQRAACEAGMRGNVYYYWSLAADDPQVPDVFDPADYSLDRVVLNTGRTGDEVRVSYNADFVLCPLNVDMDVNPPKLDEDRPCQADVDDANFYAVLVLSDGFLIQEDGTRLDLQPDEAGAQGPVARVSEVVVKYDVFGAGPRVPLTVAATFGAGGAFDIVANPNGGPNTFGGGRSGAPFSVWSASDYSIGGNTVTCQRYEFFATDPDDNQKFSDSPPNNVYDICPDCTCPHKSDTFYYLSSDNPDKGEGMDIVDEVDLCSTVADPTSQPCFPDDLFLFTFGVPRADYEILKELATKIPSEKYPDCSALSEADSGLFWAGNACLINSNAGTPHNPILLIAEGDNVEVRAGAMFFGVIYAFAPPDTGVNPDITLNGGAQIYGAVVGDSGGSGKGTGSNVIVYDQSVLDRVSLSPELQRVSPLPGTWTDRRVAP